jgi:hypothetical protein
MSVTWDEAWKQRVGTTSGQLFYRGTSDAADTTEDAYDALAGVAPATLNDLPLDTIEVEEIDGGAKWHGTANYKLSELSFSGAELNVETEEGDTSGGTIHITQSRSTRGIYSRPVPYLAAPNNHNAINLTKDRVEGVDIPTGAFAFSVHKVIPAASWTTPYKATLIALTATTNNAPFRGLAAGEGVFLGATYRTRADGNVELTYRFAGSGNRSNFVVNPGAPAGDQITVTEKKGWDYLWLMYENQEDSTAKQIVQRPIGAYVEVVLPEADWSALGLAA